MRGQGVAFIVAASVAFAPGAFAGPHDGLIAKHAVANGVPEALIHRVIRIESRGNARAAHAGNYGLMQIRLGTARGVGYSGDTEGLLDPDTNLTYAVKYLAGAYRAAGCDEDRAVAFYQRGYYGAALRECAESFGAVRVAQADAKTDGRGKREKAPAKPDTSVAKPADVIKP
jgi:soluble lytic murein transglycosylase-like protein